MVLQPLDASGEGVAWQQHPPIVSALESAPVRTRDIRQYSIYTTEEHKNKNKECK